jgi:hypothetical protein
MQLANKHVSQAIGGYAAFVGKNVICIQESKRDSLQASIAREELIPESLWSVSRGPKNRSQQTACRRALGVRREIVLTVFCHPRLNALFCKK